MATRLPRVVILDDDLVAARWAARELRGLAETVHVMRPETTPGFAPDIVLCDLVIPPLFGQETIDAARRTWPGALIIPWSGHRDPRLLPGDGRLLTKDDPRLGDAIRRHVRDVVVSLSEWM